MTDWMPLKVLANDDVSPHGAATRRPSFTRVFGLRVLRTPFSVVHALSTLAARTTLGLPSQGRQWARNFHPVRVRFGRLTTVPQSVLTVTPLESMETRRSTDAGTFATPDCAMANWAAQVGVGTFFAVAGVAAPMARNAASHTIREERARMIPSISQSGRRGRADRVPIDTDPARPAPGILRTPSSYDRGSTERAIRAAQRSQARSARLHVRSCATCISGWAAVDPVAAQRASGRILNKRTERPNVSTTKTSSASRSRPMSTRLAWRRIGARKPRQK